MMNQLLPERPHLDHLKDQARDLMQAQRRGMPEAANRIRRQLPWLSQATDKEIFDTRIPLHEALRVVAREYGFASWPKLKAALEVRAESVDRMKRAIDEDNINLVRALLKKDSNIVNRYSVRTDHYYGNQRPLAYASQRGRTEIVKLLLEAGADIHAEGNLAIARAAMWDSNIPIMEMFLARGMDVNCTVYNWGPLLTYPAETQAPKMLKWLLEHGADPNLCTPNTRYSNTAWKALIEGYDRSPRFHDCVNILMDGGAKYEGGPCIDLYRGRFREFARKLQSNPAIAKTSYELAGANLSLRKTTLLHLCADWNFLEAAQVLAAHGADINSAAPINSDGVGGHTPIFHTVNSIGLWSFPMMEWLLAEGADLSVRVTVRWVDQIYRDVTPLSYAIKAKRKEPECERVVEILKKYGARE